MSAGTDLKRVEIIVESRELRAVLDLIEQAGATGYTVIPHIHGKGHRGVRADLGFSDVLKNVMVIVIASAPVAGTIVQGVARLLARRAGLVCVTPVEACYGIDKERV